MLLNSRNTNQKFCLKWMKDQLPNAINSVEWNADVVCGMEETYWYIYQNTGLEAAIKMNLLNMKAQ